MNINKIYYPNIEETLFEYTHSSGLKVYVLPKKGYYKKFAAFGTRYGSIDSEFLVPGEKESLKVPDGIAHFLEHKLFEQKDGNVMDKYAALGASPNAFTSFNQTVYLFSCTEKFMECFSLLLDYVQNPYITEESVEKEKGIIGQEIKMYEDDPSWRVYFNLLSAIYNEHPVKKDIAGTVESISHINRDILYKCFNTFYHPSNMVIVAGGDIDHIEVFETVDKLIQAKTPRGEIKRTYPKEASHINKNYIEQEMEVSVPLFYFGYKDLMNNPRGSNFLEREVAIKILMEMFFGKSSDIFEHLYNNGLINGALGYDYTLEADYAYSMIGGEATDPQAVKKYIVEQLAELKKNGLNKSNFERIKKMQKGRFVRSINSVEKTCRSFISTYFSGVNVFDYYDIYDTITFDYANKVFLEHFDEERLTLSVIKPLKGEVSNVNN
jgi:predicted Zn-dependent peptidase